ncbi:hypothetical protein EVAR_79631_1 [Eumeta japonica]|uniref:Uncharacterized protein n=1 Tax=Eumeta variegata TaxID=151549 RepID=A0A4C1UFU3_EUMVA|nr:hypothetical protein EVAR_79631_1 [Eumeta japonica]
MLALQHFKMASRHRYMRCGRRCVGAYTSYTKRQNSFAFAYHWGSVKAFKGRRGYKFADRIAKRSPGTSTRSSEFDTSDPPQLHTRSSNYLQPNDFWWLDSSGHVMKF